MNDTRGVSNTNEVGGKRKRRWLLAGALALGLATVSVFASAHDPAHPDTTYRAVDLPALHMIAEHLRIDADAGQLAQLDALAVSARPELERLSQQAMAAHRHKVDLLLADVVDRQSLAQAQADEIRAANALATKIDQCLVRLAELMSPQQRERFREHVKAHVG